MTGIVIRLVASKDRRAWDRLFRDYIVFYEANVADDVIAEAWRRVSAGEDGFCGLVAVDDATGNLVGLATLLFHRSTWSPTWVCYLEDLFVDADTRGRGVGRALIAATYAEADRRGATRTYWATQEKNAVARRLYDDVGELTEFVQYRRRDVE